MSKPAPWLILGMGNPGAQYNDTLHNVGRETVQILAARTHSNFRRHRSGNLVAQTQFEVGADAPTVLLAQSRTFMNVSGPPYANLIKAFKVPLQQVLVIQDDLDLEAHLLRLKMGGGEGGHNGLRSLSAGVGSKDYPRLRIGIGRPPGRMDPARYVLAAIPKSHREGWRVTLERAADVAESVVDEGFVKAQMALHTADNLGEK